MRFTPRSGFVLVLPDSVQEMSDSGLVLFSDGMRRKRHSGWALLHNQGWHWLSCAEAYDEVPGGFFVLENVHVIFEKWAYKPFTLGSGDDRREYWLVPERSIIATTDKEIGQMNRQQLLEELQTRVKIAVEDAVGETEEVTASHVDEIDGELEGAATNIFENQDGEEADEA